MSFLDFLTSVHFPFYHTIYGSRQYLLNLRFHLISFVFECLLAIDLWLSASWDNLPANIVVLNLTTWLHLYLNGQMMRGVLSNCDIMLS